MTVDKTVLGKVRLIADQLWMFSKNKREANFWDLSKDDKDLTMFTVMTKRILIMMMVSRNSLQRLIIIHRPGGQT